MPTRNASARWEGPFKRGGGTMKVGGGAYEGPYSAQSRFEDGDGTNPEELLGAAHAGCFSMALALALGEEGHDPESVETDAAVHIDPADGGGFEITRIELSTRARVPGIDDDEFQRVAQAAKEGCPVSKALAGVDISLQASLES
jgi:osmotically inducible protein OsmC